MNTLLCTGGRKKKTLNFFSSPREIFKHSETQLANSVTLSYMQCSLFFHATKLSPTGVIQNMLTYFPKHYYTFSFLYQYLVLLKDI